MAIKGLTTDLPAYRLAKVQRVGTMRGGGPKRPSKNNSSTLIFGEPLNHYRFTEDVAGAADAMYKLFGNGTPAKEYNKEQGVPIRSKMTVFFLSPDINVVFDAWYKVFDSAGHMIHQCDGEYCVKYQLPDKTVKDVSLSECVPCTLNCANDPRDEKDRRTGGATSATLTFACRELWEAGFYGSTISLTVGGKNSIGNIAAGLEFAKDVLGGRIDGVFFDFWGEWKEVSTPKHGKKMVLVANLRLQANYSKGLLMQVMEGFEAGRVHQIEAPKTYAALPAGNDDILEVDQDTGEIIPTSQPAKTNQKTFHAVGVSLCGTAAAWDKFRPVLVAKILKETYKEGGDFSANRLTQEQINKAVELMNDAARLATEKSASLVKHLTERLFLDAGFASEYADNLFSAHTKIDLQKACICALDNAPDVGNAILAYADSGDAENDPVNF